jgi:hypothetical protein
LRDCLVLSLFYNNLLKILGYFKCKQEFVSNRRLSVSVGFIVNEESCELASVISAFEGNNNGNDITYKGEGICNQYKNSHGNYNT